MKKRLILGILSLLWVIAYPQGKQAKKSYTDIDGNA